MASSRPSGLGMAFLVGGVLLLAILVVAVLGQFWLCPKCELFLMNAAVTVDFIPECSMCGGKGKVSLIQRWKGIRAFGASDLSGLRLLR